VWVDECFEIPVTMRGGGGGVGDGGGEGRAADVDRQIVTFEVWDASSEMLLGWCILNFGNLSVDGDLEEMEVELRGETASGARNASVSMAMPVELGGEDDAPGVYKVANPDPYRRKDIREVPASSGTSGDVLSSTSCRAFLLIISYMLIGMLGYSYMFEQWPIRDSLYFSVVTFTTVGYGDITPKSNGGKLFSCFFALGGIGIIGVALGFIGQSLVQAQMISLEKMNEKGNRTNDRDTNEDRRNSETHSQQLQIDANANENQQPQTQTKFTDNLKQITLAPLPILIMIILGSVIVGSVEKWTWLDSIYWCIITGTTVGYGDKTPKSEQMRWFSIIFIPISVGVISAALGRIANVFVEREIQKANEKLLKSELTLEDLEDMDPDGDGEVSLLEFVEFMLKSMKKVDQPLLDDLHDQFNKLDADGSGGLQKDDLELLAERKLAERRDRALKNYKHNLLPHGARPTSAGANVARRISSLPYMATKRITPASVGYRPRALAAPPSNAVGAMLANVASPPNNAPSSRTAVVGPAVSVNDTASPPPSTAPRPPDATRRRGSWQSVTSVESSGDINKSRLTLCPPPIPGA